MVANVVSIEQILADQHVHDAKRERAVRARLQRDVLMAFFRRQRSIRINRDQARAATLRFLRACPKMQIGGNRIRAPYQDHFAFLEEFEMHPDAGAVRIAQPRCASRRANRSFEARCAELVEEALRDAFSLNQPHRSRIAVGNNGFRRSPSNFGQALRHHSVCFVPTDRLEPPFPLPADPLERHREPLRMMNAIRVSAHLGAKHALSRWMIGIAGDLDGPAVLDRDTNCARVGAIVRTNCAGELCGAVHVLSRRFYRSGDFTLGGYRTFRSKRQAHA
nr:hypothetical protein [Burkholderia pseudomallei]